jgi:chromosome segregation ATPase
MQKLQGISGIRWKESSMYEGDDKETQEQPTRFYKYGPGDLVIFSHALRLHPEIAEVIYKAFSDLLACEQADRAIAIAELENKHKAAIETHKPLAAEHERMRGKKFDLMQRHLEANRATLVAASRYDSHKLYIETSSTIFETRADKTNKENKLAELKDTYDKCMTVESDLVNDIQRHEYSLAEAGEKLNKATYAVAEAKAQLDTLLGKKGTYNPESGLQMA